MIVELGCGFGFPTERSCLRISAAAVAAVPTTHDFQLTLGRLHKLPNAAENPRYGLKNKSPIGSAPIANSDRHQMTLSANQIC